MVKCTHTIDYQCDYNSIEDVLCHLSHYSSNKEVLNDENINGNNGIKEALCTPIKVYNTFTKNNIYVEFHNEYGKFRDDLSTCEFTCLLDNKHNVQWIRMTNSSIYYVCCTDCNGYKPGDIMTMFTFFYLKK